VEGEVLSPTDVGDVYVVGAEVAKREMKSG